MRASRIVKRQLMSWCLPLRSATLELMRRRRVASSPMRQTGTRQNGEFHLGHIEPTAVLGRVVKFQPLGVASLLWREGFIERGRFVRIEIVCPARHG